MSLMIGGEMWRGLRVKYYAQRNDAAEVRLKSGSLEELIFDCFNIAHVQGQLMPDEHVKVGVITIEVSERLK